MMAEDTSPVAVGKEDRKLFSKHRWRSRKPNEEASPKDAKSNFALNDDVVDFLKPSTQKGTGMTALMPKIDVAAAQRWPAANELMPGPSPGCNAPSSLRGRGPGKKGRILAVAFVRAAPEIIGEGGDTSEEPSIEVSRRKKLMLKDPANKQPSGHKDDSAVAMKSTGLNGFTHPSKIQDDRQSIPKRSHTSAKELSPPLQKKFESLIAPQPSYGPPPGEGMGFRPSPLRRSPTGAIRGEDKPPRPSVDSEDFAPRALKRTQTGWTGAANNAQDEYDSETHSLQEVNLGAEGLARQYTNDTGEFLEAAPSDPTSISARIQHKMRAEEGRALHDAMLRKQVDDSMRPSSSDSGSNAASAPSPHMSPARSSERPFFPQGRSSFDKQMPSTYDRPPMQQKPSVLQYGSYLASDMPDSAASGDYVASQRIPSSPRTGRPEQKHSPDAYSSQAAMSRGSPGANVVPPSPGLQMPLRISTKVPDPDPNSLTTPSATRSRADSNAAREAALEDFGSRVTHMRGIFRLTAEMEHPTTHYTPMQWLRAGLWWFLRSRTGLEVLIRNRSRNSPHDPRPQEKLTQAHVDLAKTWWIVTEVIPSHPALRKYGDHSMMSQSTLARDAGDNAMFEIYDAYDMIVSNLKALLASVTKHSVMPPYQSLIQGQDQSMWIQYPKFALHVAAILAGDTSKSLVVDRPKPVYNPSSIMPLGDTRDDFCYGRMFVNASLTTDDAESDRVTLPCVLTILRPKDSFNLKLAICSQNELVTLLVQTDRKVGPTWDDIQWKSRTRGMYVQLNRGYTLNIELQENDYRQLWNIYDYTRKIEASFYPREEEEVLVHSITVPEFRYTDPSNPQAFPAETMKRCRVCVYETFESLLGGAGERKLHRGYRFLVVTSPKVKTLSSVTHLFNAERPIDFEFKSEGETPSIVLRTFDAQKQATMLLVFGDARDRSMLYACLNGMKIGSGETVFAQIPLKRFSITQPEEGTQASASGKAEVLNKFQWQDIKVLNADPDKGSSEVPRTVLSENLRLVARHGSGSVTDWLNMGPGELQIRLDTSGGAELHIQRAPQKDITASIDSKRCEKGVPDALTSVLQNAMAAQTIRTFSFHSLNDLYAFQTAITGFAVKYDGVASSLSIARRRMVVPIYKKWEAQKVRIQIVSRESTHQFVAFFDGFSHAEAMQFSIKSMDVFEKVDKRGESFLKLVDAKFALPGGKGEGREGKGAVKSRFTCFDLLEYAGEHDDITIGFETKEERDRFSDALPAATQVVSMMTMKRKI